MNGLQKAIEEIVEVKIRKSEHHIDIGYDTNHNIGYLKGMKDTLKILYSALSGGAWADVSQDNRLDSRTCACNHKGICYATKKSMGKFCRCRTIGDHADCPAFVVGKQEAENDEG